MSGSEAGAATSAQRPQPVERFKPTSGQALGWFGLVFVTIALVYVLFAVHTVTGLRIGLGAVFFGAVIWVTQMRPRATAYPWHVVLKNAVRDHHVPLAAVDEVAMGQTLSLWVGDQRYSCIGIGNSIRNDIKERRRRAVDEADIGRSRFSELRAKAERANLDERAMSYQTFVVTRLEELVESAKREHRETGRAPGDPQRITAWPEVAVLVVSGLAFLGSLLLL